MVGWEGWSAVCPFTDFLHFWFNSGDPFGLGSVGAGLDVNDEYDKEVSEAYEIGLKGNYLDGRLQFLDPEGFLALEAEFDFTYAVTDNLKFFGGVGLTDGEIEKNINRPQTEGNEAPLAPEYTVNLGGQYRYNINGDLALVMRADYQYIGETWFHTVQDNQQPAIWTALLGFPVASVMSQTKRDPFGTIDLRLSLQASKWSLTAWGRNITEEDYLAEVIPAPEFGGSFLHDGPKETYGVDLTYRF